jgi:hypothetical protein
LWPRDRRSTPWLFPVDEGFGALEPRQTLIDDRRNGFGSLAGRQRRHDEFAKRGIALGLVDQQSGKLVGTQFDKGVFV